MNKNSENSGHKATHDKRNACKEKEALALNLEKK